ncbi:MAG: CARDB domain-containing protein [Acidiferrobacterales bacterium]
MGAYSTACRRLATILAVLSLSACGGGGGGSSSVHSFDPATATTVPVFSHPITSGVPYSVKMIGLSGDPLVAVYDADPNVASPTTTYALAVDTFFGASSINNASFIAPASGTAYAMVASTVASTFTVSWSENLLTVDGSSLTSSTYGDSVYYAFDAVAGTSYQVKLRPTRGNVDVAAVSPDSTFVSGSVGSSTNTGTQTDSVFFTAASTQRYYINVSSTSVDSDFEISVATVPVEADLTVDIDSAQSDGTNVTINYTVTNIGATTYTGDVQVDGWSNAASAPTVGMTGDASTTHTAVTISALGGTTTGSLTIPDNSSSGTAYLVVDTINAIVEGNENNNVSAGVVWAAPIATYNFESGAVPGAFTMSGIAPWAVDSTTAAGGSVYSLKAGTITDSQSSCTEVTATGSTGVSFDYSVSSELGWDYLYFYIDSVQQGSGWSGTVPWTSTSYYPLTSGTHTYKWCYIKDPSVSSGSDTAWIDNVVIY